MVRLIVSALFVFASCAALGCVESAPGPVDSNNTANSATDAGSNSQECIADCEPGCDLANNTAISCAQVNDSCTIEQRQACSGGTRCDATTGACTTACTLCAASSTRCSRDGLELQQCLEDSDGCTNWVPTECEEGVCVDQGAAECQTHACELDATACEGTDIVTCVAADSGLLGWSEPMSCPAGQVCEETQCVCEIDCTPGETRCDGNRTQFCRINNNTSCPEWLRHPCTSQTAGAKIDCAGTEQAIVCKDTGQTCLVPEREACIDCTVAGDGSVLCTGGG